MLSDVYELFEDSDFRKRVTVAILRLGVPLDYRPDAWYSEHGLALALDKTILGAYTAGRKKYPYHTCPGFDPNIITDAMIIDGVKSLCARLEKEKATLPDDPHLTAAPSAGTGKDRGKTDGD